MVLADIVAGTFAGFGICAVGASGQRRALEATLSFPLHAPQILAPSRRRRPLSPSLLSPLHSTPSHSSPSAAGHPFDTIKVMMQTNPGRFRGMGEAAKAAIGQSGVLGLYRGVASPLIGMGIFNAVQFAVFGAAKKVFTEDGRNVTLNRIAGAAACTGVVVAFVEGPQDLFKCQMQAQIAAVPSGAGASASPAYKGTGDCARTIIRERGILTGPLQGIGITILRNVVGVTAYFYVYEYVRMVMAGDKPVSSLSPMQVLLAGGMGGVGYWVTCYPLDIVKTAIQCDSIFPEKRTYKGEEKGGAMGRERGKGG
jgi:solute carrier family 25 carnitine/acylcarnitine transporter 20/29